MSMTDANQSKPYTLQLKLLFVDNKGKTNTGTIATTFWRIRKDIHVPQPRNSQKVKVILEEWNTYAKIDTAGYTAATSYYYLVYTVYM